MEIPEQIGPYRPLEHLGSGGMGEVYLARAPDGGLLAVKTIRADLLARPDLRIRLRREAEALGRVRSRHVAGLVSHDLDAERPYLALRYVQGGSLRDLVAAEGPLPRAALWRLADGLARALADIHGAGYLHRDLKPANVMVVDGAPVVIDFGISHALEETRLSRHGRASGTPAYMAPELLEEGRAEQAGDVYSWAATVAHAATGRDAHWSRLGPASLARVLFAADALSPDLRDVLDAAFAPDPRSRPTAAELLERLASLAPVTGPDLHVDHPYDPSAASVALTLPGPRQATLDLPPDARPGTTLAFPGQGRPGRNGGPPGTLHLHLVPPAAPRPALPAPEPPRTRRSRRAFIWIPALLALGVVGFVFRIGSATEEAKGNRGAAAPSSREGPTALYSALPQSCRLLVPEALNKVIPGAGIPVSGAGDLRPSDEGRSTCGVNGDRRRLYVHVNLVSAAAYTRMSERAWNVFRSDLEEEERNPYSKMISRDLDLGEGSFSYERTGRVSQITTGVEAVVGNVVINAELVQEPEDRQEPEEQALLRAGLKELVGGAVAALPVHGAKASPGS